MTTHPYIVSPAHVPHANAERWSAAQMAAVAAAEAVAAIAAAEVAAEAAVTAQAAVDAAFAAAQRAAAKAAEVAAQAVLAAAAATLEEPDYSCTPAERRTHIDGSAAAAVKVALCVQAVAAAASTAAADAATVVAEQTASDIAATAAAVTFATRHPALVGRREIGHSAERRGESTARPQGAIFDDPDGRAAAGAELWVAFESARAIGYAAGTPQMSALRHAESRSLLYKRSE